MTSYNLERYYYNEYDNAMSCFHNGDYDTAEELCAALVTDFECPRLIQIQAWQLRANCTEDYWRAKSLLESALKMFEHLENVGLVPKYREHTEHMLAEVEELWRVRWEEAGEDPPQEQSIEHTYTTGEAEMEAEAMEAALAKETEALNLGRDMIQRGGSPEILQIPGGAEAPWIKALDTQQPATPAPAAKHGESQHSPPLPLSPPGSPSIAAEGNTYQQPTAAEGSDDEMEL